MNGGRKGESGGGGEVQHVGRPNEYEEYFLNVKVMADSGLICPSITGLSWKLYSLFFSVCQVFTAQLQALIK